MGYTSDVTNTINDKKYLISTTTLGGRTSMWETAVLTQYASTEYQVLLKKYGLIGSISRKGNCWDNAVMERFFLSLKMERVWQKDYASHSEAVTDVADYIVGFYNCERLHSKLGNLSPNAFERESAIQQPIDVSEIT